MTGRPLPPTPTLGDRSWRARRPEETQVEFGARFRRQKALLKAACRPWMIVGQPVRVLYDQTWRIQQRSDVTGRAAAIASVLGAPLDDCVYIRFPAHVRPTVTGSLLVELESVEPLQDGDLSRGRLVR